MLRRRSPFAPPFFRIFIPFGAAYFMSMLLGSANAIMSPILVETFDLSPSALGIMSSAYLGAFCLMQFPLGVLLDRYGARNTLAPLILSAAAGSLLFAGAQSFAHLVLARTLLGIGLAGCLMAAYKAYADWIDTASLPLVYSVQCLAGGIGGIAATRPLAKAFEMVEWRVIFICLALCVVLVSIGLRVLVPVRAGDESGARRQSFAMQAWKMIGFFVDRRFWYVAPIVVATEGVLFAYMYLWLGPWLRDVASLPEVAVGQNLMYASAGVAAGYFLNGLVADWFKKWLSWERLYLYTGLIFTLLLGCVAWRNDASVALLWVPILFLSTMAMISFPLMRNLFDDDEVGRVLSLLNFAIFLASFLMQWLAGVIIERYPTGDGTYSPEGYRIGILLMFLVNAAATAHFYYCLRKSERKSAR